MVYLEINDDSSQKFWKIEKDASKKMIITNWGKIGGNPRTKEEPYDDEAKADVKIAKQIKQKMLKGYKEKSKTVAKTVTEPKAKTVTEPKPKAVKAKPVKECPEGKVLNPTSGRCVKIKQTKKANTSSKKECPEGKVLNPASGRCVKIKQTKKATNTVSKKECPEGKVLNPESGRCVKIKQTKKKASKLNAPEPGPESKPKSTGTVVYDVVKNGVMLAHTYKDPHTGKLKNPPKGFPQAPKGWYASEKFDGYRAIWDGADFRSRTGKIFVAPAWFKSWLPDGVALDGELFMGRECFEKCGIFRKKTPDDKEWREADVTYQIFDMPSLKEPFEERVKSIERLVARQCASKPSEKCPLIVTKQTRVETEEEVFKMFDSLVSKGAEGVMLRCPGSPYDAKRSAHLLKVKPFFDAECKIIGYKPGTGKYSGKLGAFHCETVKSPKAKFYISGMSDKIRENYTQTHPVGTIVTYTYVGVGESGVPRHPNYLRKRDTE